MEKLVRKYYCFFSLISLIIGISIYIFFRGLNILLFEWVSKPTIFGIINIHLPSSILTGIILYNLPDMLWVLSGLFLLRFIWFNNRKWQNIYIYCFYGVAFIFETMQLLNNFPGTFDIMDLFFMGIGALFENLLYKNFIKRRLV